ncbi:MAG: response regulator [Chitinophagaceae bacterium]
MNLNTILIVDDDARNIFALSAVLKAKKFHCLSAGGGKEALCLLKHDPNISVVLLDMMMPDIDGYELLKMIRAKDAVSRIPVIAVTAQAMVGDREECLAAGADAYLSKPVDVDALLELLHHYLK